MPRFVPKKSIEVHDQSGNDEDKYKGSKQIRFKTSMLRSDLCDFSDAYIVVKGTITVTDPNKDALKIMHRLLLAFQKLLIHSFTMQNI